MIGQRRCQELRRKALLQSSSRIMSRQRHEVLAGFSIFTGRRGVLARASCVISQAGQQPLES